MRLALYLVFKERPPAGGANSRSALAERICASARARLTPLLIATAKDANDTFSVEGPY